MCEEVDVEGLVRWVGGWYCRVGSHLKRVAEQTWDGVYVEHHELDAGR